MYNNLNTELHKELPKFYKYRIDFIASNLSRLYSTETTYHLETGKVRLHVSSLFSTVLCRHYTAYFMNAFLDYLSDSC